MGLFAEWVMMEAGELPREVCRARYSYEGLQVDAEADGWVFARSKGHDPDALLRRLSRVDLLRQGHQVAEDEEADTHRCPPPPVLSRGSRRRSRCPLEWPSSRRSRRKHFGCRRTLVPRRRMSGAERRV